MPGEEPSWLGRCAECGSRALSSELVREKITIGGATFESDVPALVCACGESYIASKVLERFELTVAVALGRHGWASGEAFRYVRKALGYSATNVAILLGMTIETVSRWELSKQPTETRAFALLCRMAQDRLEGRSDTEDMLKAIQHPAVKVTFTPVSVEFTS